MIWNDEYETLPREAMEALQLKRLRALVDRLCSTVPFYKRKLGEVGYKQGDLRKLDDLSRLPFTTKDDLRDNYPFGLFAVPMERVVRIHASSGTTGKPTVVGYTRRDVDTWAELMARTLSCGGTSSRDIVHNAYGYGLFTGGLGAHYGAEKIGAAVIPMSGGNTKRQILIMKDFGSTILLSTPSYALNLAEVMAEEGVAPAALRLKCGLFGAEPWSEGMRREIERQLKIDALDIYGLSEVIGPGVASECIEVKQGLHVFEDHFIPEIIDPATGKTLPHGEAGELVFTTLTKEAFPVLRYRTRDISRLIPTPCSCGRTLLRMERISGRTDDMLIIRGVNVFPSQIESVLMEIEGVEPHYQLIVTREATLDVLEVQVEINESVFTDAIKGLEKLAKRVEHDIKDLLGVSCKVRLVEPKTIQRSEGKAKRVIDKRTV
ncbi:MAG TPA: phenylacetate--CoA ligase [Candidatus Methylomirabilis sp.]